MATGIYVKPIIQNQTCTQGGVFQKLFPGQTSKKVISATIQNITTTSGTVITLVTEEGNSGGSQGVAGVGQLLGPGQAPGYPGGSKQYNALPGVIDGVDIADIWWTASNTNDQIMIDYVPAPSSS
jgi:hypothetical protein